MKFATIIGICVLVLASCNARYQKENGIWSWVTYDEAAGKRIHEIQGIDHETFEVLSQSDYGRDADKVYYQGREIEGADPSTFTPIGVTRYSKDKNRVFLEHCQLAFSDPATFEILDFPYSKDNKYAYCGTIPIQVEDLRSFHVTEANGMQVNSSLGHLIEKNPELEWLKDANIEYAIYGYGDWAKAETDTEKFESFKKVEVNTHNMQ